MAGNDTFKVEWLMIPCHLFTVQQGKHHPCFYTVRISSHLLLDRRSYGVKEEESEQRSLNEFIELGLPTIVVNMKGEKLTC